MSITYTTYKTEDDLIPAIALIERDLSEPYSIYTYRYFVHQWPDLCILAHRGDECAGVVICKLEPHRRRGVDTHFPDDKPTLSRGYIGMVAVGKAFRKQGIGSTLVLRALEAMRERGANEVILEAETENAGALALYEALGFVRDKRLYRYYLGGTDAFRLKMWL
ncbi:N-alpha-acetyltransferase 30 [Coemansia furcata]|uniref:N-alpha-acetyltransferase 30 n=1 Tax=Coemansia furcata TaxID=417177 RepID=A0ACC1LQL0_9FUNG|nr:N-alpha-acetyltransferase 30 [Coemansia furcata]